VTITLTFSEWEEKYEPMQNALADQGDLYDPDDDEQLALLLAHDDEQIWTLITQEVALDNPNTAIEGYHELIVSGYEPLGPNICGYFVTVHSFDPNQQYEVILPPDYNPNPKDIT